MEEPTIYDYLASLFKPGKRLALPQRLENHTEPQSQPEIETSRKSYRFLLVPSGILAIAAQFFLEPTHRFPALAIPLYLISFGLIWVSLRGWKQENKDQQSIPDFQIGGRLPFLLISIVLLVIAFFLFRENRYNLVNISFWVLGIAAMVLTFWTFNDRSPAAENEKNKPDFLFISACLLAFLIIIAFRFAQLEAVPAEMYSDHAEKLLDVMDIFAGKFSIFFERNTGREPFQFYTTALIVKIFNTGFTFLSLKLGTVLFGLVTLIFIYLIGREIENKWVGLVSVFLAGVAYWPNVISRVALRYALYPLFTSCVLYYLIKGLRTRRINDFIICGLLIGLGLLGYSAFRIIPIFVAVIILLQPIRKNHPRRFYDQLAILTVIGLISLSVFLPLFRYWFDHPQMFSYRMQTRLMPIQKPFDAPVLAIFTKNAISSLLMPFWDNGSIWVHSIPRRPALDFTTGGFYFVGLMIFASRWIKDKSATILLLFLSIPFFMLPSILSLAYPGENPSLNRSAAAYIPIFVIAGYGMVSFLKAIKQKLPTYINTGLVVFALLLGCGLVMRNNYQLVFEQYKTQFEQRAWNTSEIGQVVSSFLEEQNEEAAAFVVPYPHWVDTRLVGFNAGYPGRDFVLWREDINRSLADAGSAIFIYKPDDFETKHILEDIFPEGSSSIFYSRVTGKEFIIYTVLND